MLDPQPFENPLRRMPLLRGRRLVGLEDRVNDRNQRSELRLFGLLGPHVARRRRIAAHLGDRVSAQSENPRRLAPALSLDKNKPSNRCVSLHHKHSRPPFRIKIRKRSASKVAGFYSATQPQNAAAPWPTIAPPRTSRSRSRECIAHRHTSRAWTAWSNASFLSKKSFESFGQPASRVSSVLSRGGVLAAARTDWRRAAVTRLT